MNANTTDRSVAIAEIAGRFGDRPELLVQILVAVVREQGWVADNDIRQLAEILNLSRAEVHGVVEYYHDFRTAAPGRHIVKICRAEACQAMGGRELEAHARGAIADDVTLEPVYCLGNCACAPAVMIDGATHGRVDAARFDALLGSLSEGK
jgi:formate dehydrogenase subunit gamma